MVRGVGCAAHRGRDHDLSPDRWTRAGVRRTVGACAMHCWIAIPSSPTLADRLEQVRAGTGRVIVVEGAAGIGKSSLLAAAGRSAEAQGATVLSARAGPLEQDAAWGVARQLFAPLQRGAELERADDRRRRARGAGAASRDARAGAHRGRDARRGARAGVPGRQPRGAGADRAPRRRRPLGRRAVAAVAGAARRPSGGTAPRRRLRGALGRAPVPAGPARGAARRRAGGPAASARARPGRGGGARARGPPDGGPELRARVSCRHRREPVPARRAASVSSRPSRSPPPTTSPPG